MEWVTFVAAIVALCVINSSADPGLGMRYQSQLSLQVTRQSVQWRVTITASAQGSPVIPDSPLRWLSLLPLTWPNPCRKPRSRRRHGCRFLMCLLLICSILCRRRSVIHMNDDRDARRWIQWSCLVELETGSKAAERLVPPQVTFARSMWWSRLPSRSAETPFGRQSSEVPAGLAVNAWSRLGRSPEEFKLDVVWIAEGDHGVGGARGFLEARMAYSQLVQARRPGVKIIAVSHQELQVIQPDPEFIEGGLSGSVIHQA